MIPGDGASVAAYGRRSSADCAEWADGVMSKVPRMDGSYQTSGHVAAEQLQPTIRQLITAPAVGTVC